MTRPRQSSLIRTAAVLAGTVAVLYFARDILIPLALAITLTLILSPAVGWLQKLHIRGFPVRCWSMLVFISVASGIGYVIVNQLVQVVSDLPAYRDNIDNKMRALRAPNKGALGKAAQSVQDLGKELATPQENTVPPLARTRNSRNSAPAAPVAVQVVPAPTNELAYLRDVSRPFLAPLAKLGIVLVFTVFLLVEESDLRNRILPSGRAKPAQLDDASRGGRDAPDQPLFDAPVSGERVLRTALRNRLVSDRRSLCGAVGNRGRIASHRALRRGRGGGIVAIAAFACGVRRLAAATTGVCALCHSGADHRESARTLALWRPHRESLRWLCSGQPCSGRRCGGRRA